MTNGVTEPVILGVGFSSRRVRLDTGTQNIHISDLE